jgi:hypothetical protein
MIANNGSWRKGSRPQGRLPAFYQMGNKLLLCLIAKKSMFIVREMDNRFFHAPARSSRAFQKCLSGKF